MAWLREHVDWLPGVQEDAMVCYHADVIWRHCCNEYRHGARWHQAGLADKFEAQRCQFLRYWNGRPWLPRPEHRCMGCCTSRDEAVQHMFDAAAVSMMIQPNGQLPQKRSWGSCSDGTAKLVQACYHNDVLPQVVSRAFQNWSVPGEEVVEDALEDAEAFRRYIRGKTW